MEETLGRYRITAPFDGQVTLSAINPGTLVRTGQKIGEFAAPGRYELEVSVGLRDAGFLEPGSIVMLSSEDIGEHSRGLSGVSTRRFPLQHRPCLSMLR